MNILKPFFSSRKKQSIKNEKQMMKKNQTIKGDVKWVGDKAEFIANDNGSHFITFYPSLDNLASKYGTDKLGHGYTKHYEENIAMLNPSKMLEIGCLNGSSLRMWRDYFPETEISTVDLFKNPENISQENIEKEGFKAYAGDQSDINFLYSIKDMYNLIIDDGSHNSDHQQITFKHMFINLLCSGGVYVIEDLHCCNDVFYWGQNVTRFEDTALWVLKNYVETGKLDNKFFTEEDNRIFSENIAGVKVLDDKIAFIWKK